MNLEPPPQPSLRLSICNLHPQETFTGFCPSCLRERLSSLHPTITTNTTTTTTTTTTTSALKSIFRGSSNITDNDNNNNRNKPSSSFFPELRRCKSFSGGKGEKFSGIFEPKRKSCDVRVRNTLWSLFNQDDERKVEIEVESSNLEFSGVGGPVIESKEEEEEEEEIEEEIRVKVPNVNPIVEDKVEEIVEQEEELEEVKTMKDHIDLDSQIKKPSSRDLKEIAGSFWSAASVLSKKLQKWRRTQKTKKHRGGGCDESSVTMQVEKPYSEIADYGFGRRSCDTDPRFSLDAGRMSFDDPRYSWDEPRASWDGHLIGRTFPRLPPMGSVVEEVVPPIRRSDNLIPVEECANSINENDTSPGGSAQTRDYYSDSLQRQRRSLDRSSSIRKKAAVSVVVECDETKSISNAKVSPTTIDGDWKDLKANSLRDDCSESVESGFKDAASVIGGVDGKGVKKSRRWSKGWNIWSLIYRRNGNKSEEEERYCRTNVVERSFSESWQELRREPNGQSKGGFNRMFRSNSTVSSRNSFNTGASLGSIRSSAETNGHGNKRKDEFMLERNRSARYSPKDIDNGLLRFYLTPMRSRRNGSMKSRPKNSHSIASSVVRFY